MESARRKSFRFYVWARIYNYIRHVWHNRESAIIEGNPLLRLLYTRD